MRCVLFTMRRLCVMPVIVIMKCNPHPQKRCFSIVSAKTFCMCLHVLILSSIKFGFNKRNKITLSVSLFVSHFDKFYVFVLYCNYDNILFKKITIHKIKKTLCVTNLSFYVILQKVFRKQKMFLNFRKLNKARALCNKSEYIPQDIVIVMIYLQVL